jgi:uncharacterized protein HemX
MTKDESDQVAGDMVEMMEARGRARRKWFNGEVSLSHILLVAGVGLAFWCTTLIKQSSTEARLTAIEEERREMKAAIAKLDGTCNELLRANTRIETKLEYIAKTHP